MNNYELFSFENNNTTGNEVNLLKTMNEYKKNNVYLYSELENAKPINKIPDKLYRDEFLEQDIEIDISNNDFRKIWDKYEKNYEMMNNVFESKGLDEIDKSDKYIKTTYEEKVDELTFKVKELDKFLLELSKEKDLLKEKKEMLELNKKELLQEKELLNIEKEEFCEYKNDEMDKLNREKIKFQNMIEEVKNKIETILN